MSRPGAPVIGCRHRTAGVHEQRGDGFGVLTPSTPFAYSQAFSRRFAYFRGVSLSVSAGQHDFWEGFDSRQLHLFGGADELQSAASRWCRSLNGAVARVERAVRHSPGLRCFLNVRVAPSAGLAGTTAQPNVDARSGGGARCVPSANPSVARVRERVRWEISHGRRPLKRRVMVCADGFLVCRSFRKCENHSGMGSASAASAASPASGGRER